MHTAAKSFSPILFQPTKCNCAKHPVITRWDFSARQTGLFTRK